MGMTDAEAGGFGGGRDGFSDGNNDGRDDATGRGADQYGGGSVGGFGSEFGGLGGGFSPTGKFDLFGFRTGYALNPKTRQFQDVLGFNPGSFFGGLLGGTVAPGLGGLIGSYLGQQVTDYSPVGFGEPTGAPSPAGPDGGNDQGGMAGEGGGGGLLDQIIAAYQAATAPPAPPPSLLAPAGTVGKATPYAGDIRRYGMGPEHAFFGGKNG